MIKPIINLIDTQHNLSLSSNSSAIKYMFVTTTEATFKQTLKWWSHKCNSYHNQDEAFNNKLLKQMKYLDRICDKCRSLNQQLHDFDGVTTRSEYQLCRRAIVGGLSIILHCMNFADVTY